MGAFFDIWERYALASPSPNSASLVAPAPVPWFMPMPVGDARHWYI